MVGLLDPAGPGSRVRAVSAAAAARVRVLDAGRSRGSQRGGAHRRVVAMPDGSVLNRYWDDRDTPRDESYREDTRAGPPAAANPRQLYRDMRAAAESGWDFSSRWFADAHTLATIDTTRSSRSISTVCCSAWKRRSAPAANARHDEACAREFADRAAQRRAAVDRYLWDGAVGAYLDYQLRVKQRGAACVRGHTLSAVHWRWPPSARRARWRRRSRRISSRRVASSRPRSTRSSSGTRPTAGRRCSGSVFRACSHYRPRSSRR